jgi:hypothetical protein
VLPQQHIDYLPELVLVDGAVQIPLVLATKEGMTKWGRWTAGRYRAFGRVG